MHTLVGCLLIPPPTPPSCLSGRRGLEVLQACAQLLMREIGTESLASGLEVTVQVGNGFFPAGLLGMWQCRRG